ncbi:MAG: hypothetical protein ACO277_08190 [Ilumatobacteraceae bacterium]
MATKLFLRDLASTLGGAGQKALSQSCGRAAVTTTTTTTSSGTNITITAAAGGQALSWFSEPLTAAVTISGTITLNIRCRESANTVNSGIALLIERANNAGTVQSTVSARAVIGAEAGTAEAARTGTRTPTSTAFSAGERIKVTLSVINTGTMGNGTFNTYHDGPATNASGDSYVTFTEDFVTDDQLDVSAYTIYGSNGYQG